MNVFWNRGIKMRLRYDEEEELGTVALNIKL